MQTLLLASLREQSAQTLNWILKQYGLYCEHYAHHTETTDNIRQSAIRGVLNSYQDMARKHITPQETIYASAGLFIGGIRINHSNISDTCDALDGYISECELRYCIAYLDPTEPKLQPVTFESKIEGLFAGTPRGELKQYHSSGLVHLFIANDTHGRTIAELPFIEYRYWNEGILTCVREFAEWHRQYKN